MVGSLLPCLCLPPSRLLLSVPPSTAPIKWQNVGSRQCQDQPAPFGVSQRGLATISSWKTNLLFPGFSPLSWHPGKSAFVSISSVWVTHSKRHQRTNLCCLLNKRMDVYSGPDWMLVEPLYPGNLHTNQIIGFLQTQSHRIQGESKLEIDKQDSGTEGTRVKGDVGCSWWHIRLAWQMGHGPLSLLLVQDTPLLRHVGRRPGKHMGWSLSL